jgi:glycosyltransferase involved in cell wall biosynthesis
MKVPLISIIVPSYNRSEMLRGAIESLLQQETNGKFSYEIVIIDDASTDETREVVGEIIKCSPGLVRYVMGEGKGYTCALNRGLAESHGDWLALFDDDELADPDWLKELYAFAVQIGAQCVGGCRKLGIPEDIRSKLGPVCRGLIGEDLVEDIVKKCNGRLLPIGGHMLIKRAVFDAVGVFDETFLTGGCDRDLVLRAMASGFKMGLTPRAVVRHMISPHRITPEHMKWYSLQFGSSFAQIDWKRWGRLKMILACTGRIGKSLLINLPLLLLGQIKNDHQEILDRKLLLWRAVGYIRRTLFLLAPRVFSQERFLGRLEFRKEREMGTKDSTNVAKRKRE